MVNNDDLSCTVGPSVGAGASCVEFRNDEDEICYGPERGPCTFGWLCNLGDTCISGQCEKTCTTDANCGTYERCESQICVPRGINGYADCYGGRCWLVACSDNIVPTLDGWLGPKDLPTLLGHELGHTFDLNHVDAENRDVNGNGIVDGCRNEDLPQPDCSTSDDCDGELICSSRSCAIGHNPQRGDSRGMRNAFNGSPSTTLARASFRAAFGDAETTLADPAFTSLFSRPSIHTPRIDCARATAPVNECAMVRDRIVNGTSVVRVDVMNGATGASWSNIDFVADHAQEIDQPADIAINANGTIAWVVFVVNGRTYLRRIPLPGAPASVTTAQVEVAFPAGTEESGDPYQTDDVMSVLPPRVTYNDSRLEVVVAAYASGNLDSDQYTSWGVPRLRIFRFGTTNLAQTSFDFGGDSTLQSPANALIGEFDIDCRSVLTSDTCVVVAPRLSSQGSPAAVNDGVPSLIRFTFSASGAVRDSGWTTGFVSDVNAITSVALSPTRMFVTHSVRNIGSTNNSVMTRHTGLTLGSPLTNSFSSDAQTCGSLTQDGYTIPAASMLVGGLSASWLESQSRLEGITFGGPDDATNFCF